MMWLWVAVAVVLVLAVGAFLLRRAHPPEIAAPEIPEADRIRRVTPAAPMVGLESALDGVTDGQGRTLRDQLSSDAANLDRLRVADDTSPILRRALDEVAPTSGDSVETAADPAIETAVERGGDGGGDSIAGSE
ncbi:MAG TPA: hypothetical protein VMM60_05605 [Ilumatobacter sp.]|nr:hypothetical protein [Ilumatobacter sp.]